MPPGGLAPLALAIALTGCAGAPRREGKPPETVFLIHGLGRTRASLWPLAWRLRRAGYRTVLVPYNHSLRSLDAITASLKRRVAREAGGGRYHLVGHSLGNIIIREGFRAGYPPGLGRVVMLAPPNSPAKLAQKLRRNLLFRAFAGDSGQRLADPDFYAALPVPAVEFAVLAGGRGHRLLSREPNDGVILVETTRLAGMKEFRVLPRTHTFIMNARETFELTERFLRTGSFSGFTLSPAGGRGD